MVGLARHRETGTIEMLWSTGQSFGGEVYLCSNYGCGVAVAPANWYEPVDEPTGKALLAMWNALENALQRRDEDWSVYDASLHALNVQFACWPPACGAILTRPHEVLNGPADVIAWAEEEARVVSRFWQQRQEKAKPEGTY